MNKAQSLAIEQGRLYQGKGGSWCKRCPSCDDEQSYLSVHTAYLNLKRNTVCRNCYNILYNTKRRTREKTVPVIVIKPIAIESMKVLKQPVVVGHYPSEKVNSLYFDLSMFAVSIACECGYKDERKVPWLPFRIHWHCPQCSQKHVTNFS